MEHKHNAVAKNVRLQCWADNIKECKSSGLSVKEWCDQHGIGLKTYYYRMRRVREAYLESVDDKANVIQAPDVAESNQQFAELIPVSQQSVDHASSANIIIGNVRIEIKENISDAFLRRIIGVIADAV